jgi:hypothetical protein
MLGVSILVEDGPNYFRTSESDTLARFGLHARQYRNQKHRALKALRQAAESQQRFAQLRARAARAGLA